MTNALQVGMATRVSISDIPISGQRWPLIVIRIMQWWKCKSMFQVYYYRIHCASFRSQVILQGLLATRMQIHLCKSLGEHGDSLTEDPTLMMFVDTWDSREEFWVGGSDRGLNISCLLDILLLVLWKPGHSCSVMQRDVSHIRLSQQWDLVHLIHFIFLKTNRLKLFTVKE
jgi:hypothetical protein